MTGTAAKDAENIADNLRNHQFVMQMVDVMTAADVKGWLEERLSNCHRHARRNTGKVREGWLEDAAFFTAAIGLIDWTADNRS